MKLIPFILFCLIVISSCRKSKPVTATGNTDTTVTGNNPDDTTNTNPQDTTYIRYLYTYYDGLLVSEKVHDIYSKTERQLRITVKENITHHRISFSGMDNHTFDKNNTGEYIIAGNSNNTIYKIKGDSLIITKTTTVSSMEWDIDTFKGKKED